MNLDNSYLYFEERPFGQAKAQRKKNVQALVSDDVLSDQRHFVPTEYPWWKTRELEHRQETADSEGVWPINHSRVERFLGDPGVVVCPHHTKPDAWVHGIEDWARRLRLHHYYRVWSSTECREFVQKGLEVRVALEVTEEWHAPPEGIIEVPEGPSAILGSHAVPVTLYDDGLFRFRNSWGENWGNNGWGAFSSEIFDRYVIEAWVLVGKGVNPPMETKTGLVCLLWKSSLGYQEVHGREIVDATIGDRLGWAFAVRRGGYLDLEEFFVWPTYRRRGIGRRLAELVKELAKESRTVLRAWVSIADCEPHNRPALLAAMKMLGLHLHPSPSRMAGFVGLADAYQRDVKEPRFPLRPATVHEALDPAVGTRLFTVWYGTNRKPLDQNDVCKGFSADRDEVIHFGRCKVAVPKSHRFGSIGSAWWKRWLRWTDDRLTVVERIGKSDQDFWKDIRESLASYPEQERHSLVFLHGFNVTFDEAAIRAAQIGLDLRIPGITAFFSWPSQGTINGYPVDEATIEASEPAITAFLRDFALATKPDRVHLIAHSMGNRGLLRALQRIAADTERNSDIRFGQIILAAADLDVDVFKSLADLYPKFSQRTTSYASPRDRAVSISKWLHKFPRVGFIPPVTIAEGLDTIEVPKFDLLDLLGHGYFANAEPLLYDIFDLIQRGSRPSKRIRLRECRTDTDESYWKMDL